MPPLLREGPNENDTMIQRQIRFQCDRCGDVTTVDTTYQHTHRLPAGWGLLARVVPYTGTRPRLVCDQCLTVIESPWPPDPEIASHDAAL